MNLTPEWAILIEMTRHEDARGYLTETYNHTDMAARGIGCDFVQDNHSLSRKAGTLRGLHFQASPYAQAKLVRCIRGAIYDVVVDIRAGSPSFGLWRGYDLTAENARQLYVPEGFAHGFVTRADDTEVSYKCSAPYAPEVAGTLAWDDPDLAIDWGLKDAPILSKNDANAEALNGFRTPFTLKETAGAAA